MLVMAQQDTLPVKRDTTHIIDTLRLNYKTTGKPVTGIAAVYDLDLDGTKTASGEIFLNIRLTGARNDIKLNSWVNVTNRTIKK